MSDELCFTSACDLIEQYRKRNISPVEVTQSILDRINQLNPVLNCFCHTDEESTLASARESEERWQKGTPAGLLDGIPISIKDLLPVRGWPTRMGSNAISADGPGNEDDPAVSRFREHGGIIIGKTNTPEFGNSGVTNSPLNGLTVNPWDITRTTGGSSGGSVAAVAAGLGPLSVGTDAGGSIRTPASFCGLIGLKPTFGRVPQAAGGDWGGISVSGPIARTAQDAALAMNVMSLPDSRDWNALPSDSVDYLKETERGIEGLNVAFSADLGFMPVDPQVAKIVNAAANHFSDLGANIVDATPNLGDPIDLFDLHWTPVIAHLSTKLTPAQQDLLCDETKETIETAQQFTLVDYLEAQYKRAELARTMLQFHETYDLLLTPTAIVSPFKNEHHMPPEWDTNRAWLWELPTFCFNLTRQPAISVPCGFTDLNLPVGLQIVAPIYQDSVALRAAYAYQHAYPTTDRRPSLN